MYIFVHLLYAAKYMPRKSMVTDCVYSNNKMLSWAIHMDMMKGSIEESTLLELSVYGCIFPNMLVNIISL